MGIVVLATLGVAALAGCGVFGVHAWKHRRWSGQLAAPLPEPRWGFMRRLELVDSHPDMFQITRFMIVATAWFGLYVDRIDRPDHRPRLHDHPRPAITLVLRGGYTDDYGMRAPGQTTGPLTGTGTCLVGPGTLHRMRNHDAHRIRKLHRTPTWMLVLAGPLRSPPSWSYWDNAVPGDGQPDADEPVTAHDRSEPTP
jgi:hypothetical protein